MKVYNDVKRNNVFRERLLIGPKGNANNVFAESAFDWVFIIIKRD